MPATSKARKTPKESSQNKLGAAREIKGDTIIISKIRQSYREAKAGQTVSLRDLIND